MPVDYDFAEVAEAIGLSDPAFAEKDFHAVQAISCILAVESSVFSLVFSGGTSLSRAHRLTERMSEDIDMKIWVSDSELAGSKLTGKLRAFRKDLCESLNRGGFQLDHGDRKQVEVHDQGRMIRVNLDYAPQLETASQLRPHLQIDLKVGAPKIKPIRLSVSSLAAQVSNRPPEIPVMQCTSLLETASEKLSALLWRVHAQQTGQRPDSASKDTRLIRHVYDLKMMEDHVGRKQLANNAESLILADATRAGASYVKAPFRACRESLGYLANEPEYCSQYEEFLKAMVYGTTKPSYEESIAWVRLLVDLLPHDSPHE